MATAAVMARAVLAAADVSMIRKYISSAASGPANSVIVLVFTLALVTCVAKQISAFQDDKKVNS